MEIKTPNGFRVVLKEMEDLSYGDYREIQRVFLGSSVLNAKGGEDKSSVTMNGDSMLNVEEVILKTVLKEIYDTNNTQLPANIATILSWKVEDGSKVMEVIDDMLNQMNAPKKKSIK